MTKTEACHKLAEINEKLYELENLLSDVESRLKWDDESRRAWYLERRAELKSEIAKRKQEHDSFISEYAHIIYS